jgi:TctA family transporter
VDLSGLVLGLETALQPDNILICLLGVTLGTMVGVLPGIGPTATVALLLPITFNYDPIASLIMLAGIYYGAQYGGSTTAILINLPGESSAAVTALDGHQMARQGRAGPALATAALGSFFAGTVATAIVAVFAPPMASVALKFGPAEYFSLVVLGLVVSIALASGSTVKALAMIVLGLLLGTVGQDLFSTGVPRFTFGIRELYQGLDFVSIAVGLFGLAEIIRNLERRHTLDAVTKKVKGLWLRRDDFRRIRMPVLRGTAVGSALGVLPGGGHVLAAFTSYSVEKRVSKDPEKFGRGAIEGVASPESANNAAAQTSFIPLLTLGLPAHPVMALLVGAFIIQGITPGPNVIHDEPELFWGLIASFWVGNLLLVVLNLPLIGVWVRLISVPYEVLFPAIIAFATIGCFSLGLNPWDVYVIAIIGVVGYFLIRWGCEPVPLLFGFVLAPLLEENLRRAMIISRGDPSVLVTRPISAVLLFLALVALVISILPTVRRKREVIFSEEE